MIAWELGDGGILGRMEPLMGNPLCKHLTSTENQGYF